MRAAEGDVIGAIPFANSQSDELDEWNWFGDAVVYRLGVHLSSVENVHVLAANVINKALEDERLFNLNRIDTSAAKKIGQAINAKYIIIGSYSFNPAEEIVDQTSLSIQASIINVQSDSLSQEDSAIVGTWANRLQLVEGLSSKIIEKLGWKPSADIPQMDTKIFEHIGKGKEGIRNYDPEAAVSHFLKAIELDAALHYGKQLLADARHALAMMRGEDEINEPLEEIAYQRALDRLLRNVEFSFASTQIRRASYHNLNLAVEVLKNHSDIELLIEGHTDSTGAEDYNMAMSQKRANSVEAYLVSKGVAADRLEAIGRGETEPIASNETEAGQAKNRRTEITVKRTESNIQSILDIAREEMIRKGMHGLSEQDLKTVIRLDDRSAEAHFLLTEVYAGKEKYEAAIKEYKRAIELDPERRDIHLNLAYAYVQAKDYPNAVQRYEFLIEQKPKLVTLHNNLGLVNVRMKDYETAEAEFKQSIELRSNYAKSWWYLVDLVYAQTKAYQKAVETLKDLIDIDPTAVQAHTKLGWYLYLLQKYDESIATNRKAIELDADHQSIHSAYAQFNLAFVLLERGQAGDYEQALAEYEKATQRPKLDERVIKSAVGDLRGLIKQNRHVGEAKTILTKYFGVK